MSASSFFVQPFTTPLSQGATVPNSELNFWTSGLIGTQRQTVFADAALSVPLPNPVVADGTGAFPVIYLTPGTAYGVVWTTSSVYPAVPTQIDTVDPYSTSLPSAFTGDTGTGGTAGIVPAPPAGSAALHEYLGADGAWDPLLVVPPAMNIDPRQAGYLGAPIGNGGVPLVANYTPMLADLGHVLISGTAGPLTISLSTDLVGAWPLTMTSVILLLVPPTGGAWTIVPPAGGTLFSPPSFNTSGNRVFTWGLAALERYGVNAWMLTGTNIS